MTADSGVSGQFNIGCAACHVHATIMYKAVQSSAWEFLQSATIWFLAYQSVLPYPEVPDQKSEADCWACEAFSSDGCGATWSHCTEQQTLGCPDYIFGCPDAPQCAYLSIRSITNLPHNHIKTESGRTSKDHLVQPLMGKGTNMRLCSTLSSHLLKIASSGEHCSRDCLTTKLTLLKTLTFKKILPWYCAALRTPVETKQVLKRMTAFILTMLPFMTAGKP